MICPGVVYFTPHDQSQSKRIKSMTPVIFIELNALDVRLRTRFLLAGIAILVFTTLVSSALIFGVFQNRQNELPQNKRSETPADGGQLYLMVGSKHVPRAAMEILVRYNIQMELNREEKGRVTPLEDFFIMGSSIPKDIDKLAENPNDYKISIVGDVENPITLSYEDIITKFEMKHMITELYCMPSLTGIGKFSGPSLYDLISYAKPTDNNAKIVFVAGDGYEKGWYGEFTLSKIKDHKEDFLLAVAMNGYPLAIEHGYPVRLALDSEPGSLWVKWLVKIVIVPEDATREEYNTQISA